MSDKMNHVEWIDAWLAGTLAGEELAAFEREREQNDEFAKQCLIAAVLHKKGAELRQNDFLKKLTDLEQNLEQEGFFEQETHFKKEILKKIEGELDIENFFKRNTTQRAKRIFLGSVQRRWLAAAAAIAAILVVAWWFFVPPSPYIVAQHYLDKAPKLPFLSPKSSGAVSKSNTIDSLLNAQDYNKAIDSIRAKNSDVGFDRYWEAVCLLHLSEQPEDTLAKKAVSLLEYLEKQEEFTDGSKIFVQCQLVLAYLKNNQLDKAIKLLEQLKNSPDDKGQSFAIAIGNHLR